MRVIQQSFVPAFIHRAAGLAQAVGHAHGLHRKMFAHLPLQIFTGDKVAQSGMERADMVVLEVNLDKGFPVVVAYVHFHMVERVAREIELLVRAECCHVGSDITSVGLEQHAVPFLERVVLQVQARIVLKMRRTQ